MAQRKQRFLLRFNKRRLSRAMGPNIIVISWSAARTVVEKIVMTYRIPIRCVFNDNCR